MLCPTPLGDCQNKLTSGCTDVNKCTRQCGQDSGNSWLPGCAALQPRQQADAVQVDHAMLINTVLCDASKLRAGLQHAG